MTVSEQVIGPGEFLLAHSMEALALPPDLAGEISPLSHVARFGLGIHLGANWINPGFGSSRPTQLALELVNNNSTALILQTGMPIAHLRLSQSRGYPPFL